MIYHHFAFNSTWFDCFIRISQGNNFSIGYFPHICRSTTEPSTEHISAVPLLNPPQNTYLPFHHWTLYRTHICRSTTEPSTGSTEHISAVPPQSHVSVSTIILGLRYKELTIKTNNSCLALKFLIFWLKINESDDMLLHWISSEFLIRNWSMYTSVCQTVTCTPCISMYSSMY